MMNKKSIVPLKERISDLTVNSNFTRILVNEQKNPRDKKQANRKLCYYIAYEYVVLELEFLTF